jgi:hypothetical protein
MSLPQEPTPIEKEAVMRTIEKMLVDAGRLAQDVQRPQDLHIAILVLNASIPDRLVQAGIAPERAKDLAMGIQIIVGNIPTDPKTLN